MWALLVVVFLLVFFVSLGFMPFKSRRIKAMRTAGASLAASIFALFMFVQSQEDEARRLGFTGVSEQREAKESGVTDPVVWRAATEEKRQAAAAEIAKRQEEDRARQQEEEAKCASDLQCLAEKKSIEAAFKCAPIIERLAKNNFEWIDKWYETKFDHYKWKDRQAGVITFAGDKIKYQNGFGAWVLSRYECDYNALLGAVMDARASPGRLPLDR